MNIKLNKPYGRRKPGQVLTVTNDKGREMIKEGIGTETTGLAFDDMKPAKISEEVKERIKNKPLFPIDEEE